jgi:hypothetical protein
MTPGHMVIDRLKLLFKIFTIFFLIYFQYVKEKFFDIIILFSFFLINILLVTNLIRLVLI